MPRFTETGGIYAQARSWALNAIERFETSGVRVPQHGRLREYAKQFEHAVRAIETGEAGRLNLEYLHRALLDVTELSLIAEQFATATPVNGFRYAANRAMKGGKLLGDEKNQSSARDFQFELFIGAIFNRGGYDVSFEDPDVVRGSFGDVGIAREAASLHEQPSAAIRGRGRAIDRSGRLGLIALDISSLIMPSDLDLTCGSRCSSSSQCCCQCVRCRHAGEGLPARTVT
jgi:hypothetical protein